MKREGDAKQRHHARRRPHTHNNYNKSGRFSVCHLIARARRQTETNGMSRICDSLAASVLGCFLFLVALVWSAWSEGHYVTQLEVIQSARAAAVQYSCDSPDIVGTPQNELIFLEGCSLSNLPTWTDTQTDGFDYGDDASGAWFRSSTSMWQWTQTEHSETQGSGDSKRTYRWWTHRAVWKDRLLDSPTECDQPSYDAACRVPACRSGYEYPASTMSPPSAGACNPSVWPASPPPGTRYAPDGSVSVNAQNSVTLNSEQLRQLTSSRVVSPTNVPSTLGAAVPLPVERLSPSNTRRTASGGVTTMGDSSIPRIGDVTTTFTVASATHATLLAAVNAQGKMVPWHAGVTARVPGSPTTVNKLAEGSVSRAELLDVMDGELLEGVWAMRVLTLIMFVLSTYLALRPIAVAPTAVPCIGPMVGDLLGCAVGCAAVVLGCSSFLTVTALCWIAFRPGVGIVLLLLALLLAGGFWRLSLRRRRRQRAAGALTGPLTQTQMPEDNCGTRWSDGSVEGPNGNRVYPQQQQPPAAVAMPVASPLMDGTHGMYPSGGVSLAVAEAVPMGQAVVMQEVVPLGLPAGE